MEQFLIPFLILLVAILYASIGHGGASGYLALLALFDISLIEMKSSALILNIFVSGIAFYHYSKAGHFKWKLFYPFALLSVPMAYLGSFIKLDPTIYKQLLGICLILAIARILGFFGKNDTKSRKEIPLFVGLLIGAALGLFSGMIGIGGGIILTPLILLCSWASLKETAAVSALFILVNSISGIFGLVSQGISINSNLVTWIIVAIIGGFIGGFWGSKKAQNSNLKQVLAGVLFLASLKLIFI